MARQKKRTDKAGENVVDYRHKNVTRVNIPPAGLKFMFLEFFDAYT